MMAHLNPQQMQAATHISGPLLVLAGAGTGKTRVITERIAFLLKKGVNPKNILGVTFTNKAANEMRERVAKMLGKRIRMGDLALCTFHSLAVRILRRDAEALGYTRRFSICDHGEQLALVRKASATVRGGAQLKPDEALNRISSLKNKGVTPEQFRREAVDENELVLHAMYRRYQDSLRRLNCFDFDDLLFKALALFSIEPPALTYWRERFRYIMVDEFQDANAVQFSLVRKLSLPLDNLCVVGDDDQSIYSWRGAVSGNILTFNQTYPSASVVTLEQNYRSTTTILSAANAVIHNNPFRREKTLWSDLGQGQPIRVLCHNDQFEEASAIAESIRSRREESAGRSSWRDFAVIIRANGQSRPLEDEFLASRIPYEVIGGQSVFDRKEARDALSYLAVISNPESDNELLRIINVPPRGIGDKTVDALTAHSIRHGEYLSALLSEPGRVEGLGKQAVAACRSFSAQIARWRERLLQGNFEELVRDVLEDADYQSELSSLYPDPLEAASRWNAAIEIGESLATYSKNNPCEDMSETVGDFLCEAMLLGRADGDGRKKDVDAVKIITAHSAKGLEFPFVFIPGLEEEIFPHKNAIEGDTVEEERRLFYVAMTRARLELTLLWNRQRILRGREVKRQPSRFLGELPAELTESSSAPTQQEKNLEWVAQMRNRMKKSDEG